jgi:unsaturated rhamnogalacturonyl hydrolase
MNEPGRVNAGLQTIGPLQVGVCVAPSLTSFGEIMDWTPDNWRFKISPMKSPLHLVLSLATKGLAVAIAAVLATSCVTSQSGANKHFSDWPAGTSPADVGQRVAENFMPRKYRYETNPQKAHLGVIYPEVITWYGALTVAQLSGATNLTAQLVAKFEPFHGEAARHINQSAHVDYRVFGIVPLEIYLQTGDDRARKLGIKFADAQWEKTTSDGVTAEARYWIDDMYMIPAIQVQAYRATGEMKYLDRAALAMVAYLDKLQQPNGLFFHGESAPFYWGRGNGWMAAGVAELLRSLPATHPQQARIMKGYRQMMAALLQYQDDSGLWNQLIDKQDSWPETSGSAMFTFAFVTGVKEGWLDEKTYGPAARRAWLGLVKQLDANANLGEVCIGTDKADRVVGPALEAQLKFYNERPRVAGDLHGQAPMLWTASALMR